MTNTWQVDVEVSSHDLLKLGVVAVPWCDMGNPRPDNARPARIVCSACDTRMRVSISADHARSDHEALIFACDLVSQVASRVFGMEAMVTSAVLVSYPIV